MSGNYADLLAIVAKKEADSLLPFNLPSIVGALSLSGKIEDAQSLFNRSLKKLNSKQKVECQFYLGIGFCRHSQYPKSRAYFAKNLRQKPFVDKHSRFFIYQGLAFYRYFSGRFEQALSAAEKAWECANEVSFIYGKAYAADLMAHCLIETGQIRNGISRFDDAIQNAELLGNGSLWNSFKISKAIQIARFGIDPHSALATLQSLLTSLPTQDVYSQAGLLLELAKQQYLRGMVKEAKASLDKACHSIYSLRHRRFSAMLNLRYAHLHRLRGENYLSLNLVRSAQSELDPTVDRAIEQELSGLEQSLCQLLNIDFSPDKRTTAADRSGRYTARRIKNRHENSPDSRLLYGEDPLGDLKDQVVKLGRASLPAIAASGYWGLVFDIPGILSYGKSIHLDLLEESVLVVDNGDVKSIPRLQTPIFTKILRRLHTGPASKELLIRDVWQYRYSPAQHDTLVYTTISRLRQLLEQHSNWIHCIGGVYAFLPGVQVYDHLCDWGFDTNLDSGDLVVKGETDGKSHRLSYRQRHIVQQIIENGDTDLRTALAKFDVSDMTVRRDLKALVDMAIISRIGKGRAIKYVFKEQGNA